MNNKPRIALLLGGTSPEREVSKSSAASIYAALLSMGYKTTLIDPAYGIDQPKNAAEFFDKKDYRPLSIRNYIEAVNSKLFDEIDLAFIGLHGKWGEDGTIQSLLELRGIKYTGSNVLASSLAMDKIMTKNLFNHYDVITPKWFSINQYSANLDSVEELIEKELKYPCVLKPHDQGSTVGLTICKDNSQVKEGLKLAFQYSPKVLIEEYIPGREITVAIIENKALPVLEIKPKHDVYDYECKYTGGMSEYIVPADITKEASQLAQEEALKAFTALGCEVYARVDFRLSNDNIPYCLEVNSLPGMTSTSLVPKMAKAVGISFEELIERIIKLSLS